MNRIYLTCFSTGTGSGCVNGSTPGGDVIGYALAEDGMCLAQHLSSNVDFSKHDMGLWSNWKHENYNKYYPDGWELVWIDDADNNETWKHLIELNHALPE